jgi:anti-sigma factor RsiW
MSACSGSGESIHRYLDAEMTPQETIEFEKHLIECSECRAQYQSLRAVSDLVRGARPLYEVPEASVQEARRLVQRAEAARRRSALRTAALVAAAACVGALLVVWQRQEPAFPIFAGQAHRRFIEGGTKLGIRSSDPQAVTEWLRPRIEFPLRLPDYPVNGGEPKRYRLAGAGVMPYGGQRSAFIAYDMGGKPITLLMSAAPRAAPSGGDVYRSGKLVFRFFERDGLHIISWTDRGIHYALVSELGGRGAESCAVCHGQAAERHLIEGLTPGRRN